MLCKRDKPSIVIIIIINDTKYKGRSGSHVWSFRVWANHLHQHTVGVTGNNNWGRLDLG